MRETPSCPHHTEIACDIVELRGRLDVLEETGAGRERRLKEVEGVLLGKEITKAWLLFAGVCVTALGGAIGGVLVAIIANFDKIVGAVR